MSIKYFVSLFAAALIGYFISPSYSQDAIFCNGFEDCPAADPALEARVAALEALLADVSRGTDPNTSQDTLTFTAMNVQVVSGSGTTDGTINGTGNLIIGYNETGHPFGDVRTGSHMLVAGSHNNYTSFGGMVVGLNSETSGLYSSVSGGLQNTASGLNASVSAGAGNTASGPYSSVSGGTDNTASGDTASVSGGESNTASGLISSVSGGFANAASEHHTSVSGGHGNTASGIFSSVSGGFNGTASGDTASVSGGGYNEANGLLGSVSGGENNSASGTWSSVSGGNTKTADVNYCTTAGNIGTDCAP